MKSWPQPKSLKQLRGFLDLTGYYRRFIKHYGIISKPLTNLLIKVNFGWTHEVANAFDQLKEAMVQASILALPNFQERFTLETDASKEGVGIVLQQKGHPITYLSKVLALRHQTLSAYEIFFSNSSLTYRGGNLSSKQITEV